MPARRSRSCRRTGPTCGSAWSGTPRSRAGTWNFLAGTGPRTSFPSRRRTASRRAARAWRGTSSFPRPPAFRRRTDGRRTRRRAFSSSYSTASSTSRGTITRAAARRRAGCAGRNWRCIAGSSTRKAGGGPVELSGSADTLPGRRAVRPFVRAWYPRVRRPRAAVLLPRPVPGALGFGPLGATGRLAGVDRGDSRQHSPLLLDRVHHCDPGETRLGAGKPRGVSRLRLRRRLLLGRRRRRAPPRGPVRRARPVAVSGRLDRARDGPKLPFLRVSLDAPRVFRRGDRGAAPGGGPGGRSRPLLPPRTLGRLRLSRGEAAVRRIPREGV